MKRLPTCVVFAVTLSLAPAALAQTSAADDAFKAGIDARDNKKWADVVTQMRRAIQLGPQEATRKVRSGIGGVFRQGGTEYLPHYFLGEAFFNQQNCAGALEEWTISQQQGAIRARADLLKILQAGAAACEAKGVLTPAKYEPLYARTNQYVTDVVLQARTVSNLGTANPDLFQGTVREQYTNASNEVQTARTRLEAATRSRATSDFDEATAAADRAKAILTTLENTLTSALSARLGIQGQQRGVEQVLDGAEAFDKTIESKKAALTPQLSAARAQGRDAISRARDRLSAGVKASSESIIGESRTLAQDASTRLKQVIDDLTKIERESLQRRLAEAVTRAQETFSLVDGAFATLDRLSTERPAATQPDLPAKREAIKRQVDSARNRFGRAQTAENVASVIEATRLTAEAGNQLNELIALFGPVTLTDRGVNPALLEGARLYFSGQYQEALAALNPAEGFPRDLPLQLHIHLIRAASSYALFVRSGEKDQALRTQALDEIAQCTLIDSAFEPDRRAFTPRFIAFFHDTAVAGGKSAATTAPQ